MHWQPYNSMTWQPYRVDNYGFAMLVPPGTALVGTELGGGWGALQATIGTVTIYAVAKLGMQATPMEIETYAIQFTGIPATHWKKLEEGQHSKGWLWYRTYEAQSGNTLVFAVLGTGPRGNYLLVIRTTVQDFAANRPLYDLWYHSLTLY